MPLTSEGLLPWCDQCKQREAIWQCLVCGEKACADCVHVHEDSHRKEPGE